VTSAADTALDAIAGFESKSATVSTAAGLPNWGPWQLRFAVALQRVRSADPDSHEPEAQLTRRDLTGFNPENSLFHRHIYPTARRKLF
jgi:hypothetical protein